MTENQTTLKEMQANIDQWIKNTNIGYFSELTNLGQLTEEVGELARIITRTYGEQNYKPEDNPKNITEEIGDILFVLTCLANQTGVDLNTAFQQTMHKKNTRDKNRH
jgi:NTP pyrophosphatase (non-canonical NTP hydrolase)